MGTSVGDVSWEGLVEAAREMGGDPDLVGLSDAEVEREVRDGASRIAALTCEWLLHVAELVVRGVWADQGARTPGQWLSWACGESASAAREHVRVGIALRHLPLVRSRFSAGTLSYSKVRAITRCATPEIERSLVDLADSAPASVLETILARSRRSADELVRWEDGPPDDVAARDVRDVRRVQVDADTVELRVRLPLADAAAAEDRLDRLVEVADAATPDDTDDDAGDGAVVPLGARRATALLDALAAAVDAGPADRSGVDDHLLVLHTTVDDVLAAVADDDGEVDDDGGECGEVPGHTDGQDAGGASAEAPRTVPSTIVPSRPDRHHVVTGRGRGMFVRRQVLARLACDARMRLAATHDDGHPADVGRRTRTIPPDLRRALQLRDRHCRFPGCHTRRRLHAHHVIHWAAGGPTDLDNLVLLCGFHHRFVHDRDWTLRPVAGRPGRWTFHAPDDTAPLAPVLRLPGASAEAPAHPDAPHPGALQPPWFDGWYDLDETVRVVSAYLLDLSPVPVDVPPHPAIAA